MGKRITSTEIKRGSVSFSKRTFQDKTGKSKETRVWFYFPTGSTAGTPMPITRPHSLGRVPSSYTVVNSQRDPAAGPPGTVFARFPWATRTQVVLQCTTDETWCEVVLR